MKRANVLTLGLVTLAGSLAGAQEAWAIAHVAIINGSSTTSETDTTSSITQRLVTLHTAAGNSPVVLDTVPSDLSTYAQVWDIRFSNSTPLTPAVRSQYSSFLSNGGGMFVMGENSAFMTRNNSIFSFVSEVGGGSLAFDSRVSINNIAETVYAPFTGPNPVSTITYSAPGAVSTPGTGHWMTENLGITPSYGSAIVWYPGELANAPAGTLTVVFDVNFMQTNASAPNQAFAANLVGYINDQVNSAVPEPATAMLGVISLAGALMGATRRRA